MILALRRGRSALASAEGLVVVAMTAVIVLLAITGIVSLRQTGPASEAYATAMADQRRVLNALTRDLQSAVTPATMDTDEQGIKIAVPDAYGFGPDDPRHRSPVAADGRAWPPARVAYRYFNGAITRTDPWQPLVRVGDGYADSGPVTISTSANAFPTVLLDAAAGPADPSRYRVTFHSPVEPLADTNSTRVITLPHASPERRGNPASGEETHENG